MKEEVKRFLLEVSTYDLIARTIYGEARGEILPGQVAVANVIKNRYQNIRGRYGVTIHGVILKPYQFSCWNENDPNFKKLISVDFNEHETQLVVAALLTWNLLIDNTQGATHYHAKSIIPNWTEDKNKMVKTVEIGNHIFYKEL